MNASDLSINDYTYDLPEEKIAYLPSQERGASKLLVWQKIQIIDDKYLNISDRLPKNSLIVFNNSKVIPARLHFKKSTGASIEIFCLEPLEGYDFNNRIGMKATCKWKCFVGGISKWKDESLQKLGNINGQEILLSATLIERGSEAHLIEFAWDIAELNFIQILEVFGVMPLPPYIKRKAELSDAERYQTVFAKANGSVAAPTAALHFTDEILNSLRDRDIKPIFVTLHVGAGTFKPVKAEFMKDHEMHSEWIEVSLDGLKELLIDHNKAITAVGTTSTRTLESIYWMGVKAFYDPEISIKDLAIKQWEVYELQEKSAMDRSNALTALKDWMIERNLNSLFIETQILIAPGYTFKMVDNLLTNFHQPQSTLLLLIAAAIGENWKLVYDHALKNDYRFLSYGDGCLLEIDKKVTL